MKKDLSKQKNVGGELPQISQNTIDAALKKLAIALMN